MLDSDDRTWHISDGRGSSGPMTGDAVRQLLLDGTIDPTTLVWREGMPNWIQARFVDQLAEDGGSERRSPPLPNVGSSASEASVASHLQKIQEKLLNGSIDRPTYEMFRNDLLSTCRKSLDPLPDSNTSVQERLTGVRFVIHLDGKAGTNSNGSWIEVYLDDEKVGKGSAFEGIHVEGRTEIGQHVLKLVETNEFATTKVGRFLNAGGRPYLHPIQFAEPGLYRIFLEQGSLWEQMNQKPFRVSVSSAEVEHEQ